MILGRACQSFAAPLEKAVYTHTHEAEGGKGVAECPLLGHKRRCQLRC